MTPFADLTVRLAGSAIVDDTERRRVLADWRDGIAAELEVQGASDEPVAPAEVDWSGFTTPDEDLAAWRAGRAWAERVARGLAGRYPVAEWPRAWRGSPVEAEAEVSPATDDEAARLRLAGIAHRAAVDRWEELVED